jgi:serine/threonine protein kinase
MTPESSEFSDRESELGAVICTCLKAVEAGEAVDPRELQARHPQFAAELAAFFAGRDRFERFVAPVRAAVRGGSTATDSRDATADNQTAAGLGPLPRAFGAYELLEEIGRGGMGVVYRARHLPLGRLVALKVVRAGGHAWPEEVQRLRNEAETVALLDHPNIVPVYDVGEHDGQVYLAMKLVDGASLSEQLARFVGRPKLAAQLLVTVARAVHHAHQRGVLHRDLKPSNILLDAEGLPHVSDFGLAKRATADSGLTQSGALVGTPSCMAPEQASGQKGQVTTATDVYGLGAVLYALLTGRPPFRGDTVLETLGVRHGPNQSPAAISAADSAHLGIVENSHQVCDRHGLPCRPSLLPESTSGADLPARPRTAMVRVRASRTPSSPARSRAVATSNRNRARSWTRSRLPTTVKASARRTWTPAARDVASRSFRAAAAGTPISARHAMTWPPAASPTRRSTRRSLIARMLAARQWNLPSTTPAPAVAGAGSVRRGGGNPVMACMSCRPTAGSRRARAG